MAATLWAAMASPSEDTISPTYRGCRIHRYGTPVGHVAGLRDH